MCKYCEKSTDFIVDPSYYDDLEYNPSITPEDRQKITGCYPILKDGDPGPKINPPLGTILRSFRDDDSRPLEEVDRVIWLEANKLYADNSRREYGERCVEIKFCPMCGSKLVED